MTPPTSASSWIELRRSSLIDNLHAIRAAVGEARVVAVLKADAYGHGAVEVARTLVSEGVEALAVARLEEAEQLRSAGVGARILLLSAAPYAEVASRCVALDLQPVISSLEQLRAWTQVGDRASALGVHVEIDTGMHRSGLSAEQFHEHFDTAGRSPSAALRVVGLQTHFSESECPNGDKTARQLDRFLQFALGARPPLLRHAANSAASLHEPLTHLDAVRVGGALYGVDLWSDENERRRLSPVLRVAARVAQIHELAVGESVGYGSTWRASRPSRIGLVPVGYADGYSTRFGGGSILTDAGPAPLAGRISMDSLSVDLTDAKGVEVGSEVTLLGRHPSVSGADVSVHELATRAGMGAYEVLCGFGRRLGRHWLD